MQSEIDALEARLYRLRQAMGDGAPRVASPVRPRRVVQGRSRASSHEGIAGKQLGGRFAGLIRRLPAEERAQYQEIKAKQHAAVG